MKIEILQATLGELNMVAEILVEAAIWLKAQGIPLWRPSGVSSAAIQADVEAGHYFLALHNGHPAGAFKYQLADASIWPDAEENEAAYIHRLAVKRAFAGGQLSFFMLQWAAERAGRQGRHFLRLDCDAARPRLRAVYERFGFIHHSYFQAGPYYLARYQLPVQAMA